MGNLKKWLLSEANNEEILGVVIGGMGWGPDYGKENVPNFDEIPKFKVLSWDKAKGFLDYDFDEGYGSPNCQAITAWTETKVIAISQYDGATGIFSLPRNPVDHDPIMPGG
jgi:hypothetical protein